MKNYQLGIYEKAMPDHLTIAEKLRLAKQSGFDYMEVSIDETQERLSRLKYTDDMLFEIQSAMHREAFYIRTMCLSGHRKYPLGSHNKEIRRRSLEIAYDAVDFASKLGIRLIQLAGYDVYYEPHDNETARYFMENLRKSVRYAAQKGVFLGFETMETPFMDTTEKAMGYVSAVNSPFLGIYPDIGNLQNAAAAYNSDVFADLKKGTGHIFAAHLKETKPGVYRNMRFGTGHTEYVRSIAELMRAGVGMFTAEFWYLGEQNMRYIEDASVFLREKLDLVGS